MRRNFLALAFLALFVVGCQSDQSESTDQERPYHPWIMRSVLDGMPRMITIALHEDLWVAYHTGRCGIAKAWKGHVNYEGAVFTTAHGPQPVSVGDAYLLDSIADPWQLLRGTEPIPAEVRYAGHRIRDGHAELMFRLKASGLEPVMVYEMVEYAIGENNQVGLERVFSLEGLPEGYQVRLHTSVSSVASSRNIETNGAFEVTAEKNRPMGSLQILDLDGHLTLKPQGDTRFVTWFVGRPAIRGANAGTEADDESLPLGQRLIERNDCKTCHNTSVRTIGPAYAEVAERYPNNEETVGMLARKVIKGGAGIWGIQVMSPHPTLSETDACEMVRYILSLDTTESAGSAVGGTTDLSTLPPATDVDEDDLLPGAITEVFVYDRELAAIPVFSGKPKLGGVMPNFDNIEGAKFIGISDDFGLRAQGYLHIPEKGEYTLQIWSDDGSRFSLNGKVLIDHDGIHGTSSKEQIVALDQGYYPFLLEYFQGQGGRFLSMNWKRPGGADYEVIPATLYFHRPDQRAVTSGLTLPMSAISLVPGDQFPLQKVHPAYDLYQARPFDFLPKVGGMDFLTDGTLVLCTWDATGRVYLIRNHTSEDPSAITVKEIAWGLAEPLGLKVVDNEIYVLQKQELTKLVDTDGDELIDEYRTVSNQWETSGNFHEFAFGLVYRDGYFYANLAIAIEPGGASVEKQIQDRGKVIRISKDNGSVEFIAHGLRTPNGIGWGVDDELFVADNQGDWLPSSKIVHVTKGDWFGSRAVDFEGTADLKEKPPVVWLPQDEIGNSPSTPLLLKDGPYAGQMMHGEVTHGGLKRVFVEKVNGEYQGAVFRFIQGLEAGVNRTVYGPDGSIYIGGIGNPGNWAQAGKLWYGLQRLKYNNNPVFEMLAVRAKSDGIEIEFTEPLQSRDGWDPADFEVKQWKYVPTAEYGGPKVNEKALTVQSAHVSADRKKVFLALNGMQAGHVVYVHLRERFISDAGRPIWSTEAWYTLNQIPQNTPGDRSGQKPDIAHNTLTEAEKAQGWNLLFDGASLAGWHNYGKESTGSSWVVSDGTIHLNSQRNAEGHWQAPDGGDILTDGEYENFEFRIEWKISNCGNSGIIYNVVESNKYEYPWQTGPEMQILDNSCHPDTRFRTHQAGDLYDLIASSHVTVKPAGEWNTVRLIKKDGHVEHWLNGVKIVEFDMYTDRWAEMIANSKFKDMPDFGKAQKGKIALQDHSDPVWFRNIMIREL